MFANYSLQLCSQASELEGVGTIDNCVLRDGREHVISHSVKLAASWAVTPQMTQILKQFVLLVVIPKVSRFGGYSVFFLSPFTGSGGEKCLKLTLLPFSFELRAVLHVLKITVHRFFISLEEKIQIFVKRKLFSKFLFRGFPLGCFPRGNSNIFLRVSYHTHCFHHIHS